LPALFDTAQLADAAAIERRLAQQMTYCLRAMGVLHTAGKRGNAIVYRLASTPEPFTRARAREQVNQRNREARPTEPAF
jgi:hypothetical protein